MIFYFTSTGNSLAAAKQIAKKTDDKVISISDCMRTKNYNFTLADNESMGFVFPVYFCGIPIIVRDFLGKINVNNTNNHYIYSVATCGGTSANTLGETAKLLQKNGITMNAGYKVKMPGNYAVAYKMPDKQKAKQILNKSNHIISQISTDIKNKTPNSHPTISEKASNIIGKPMYKYYITHRSTDKFHINGECTDCGLCESICPMQTIKIENKKPVWKGECAGCLGCLHRCPQSIIQYGKSTEKNGRYVHPTAFSNK